MDYLKDKEIDEISKKVFSSKKPNPVTATEKDALLNELEKLRGEKIEKWGKDGVFDTINSLIDDGKGNSALTSILKDVSEVLEKKNKTNSYFNFSTFKLGAKLLWNPGIRKLYKLYNISKNISDPVFQRTALEKTKLFDYINKNSELIGNIVVSAVGTKKEISENFVDIKTLFENNIKAQTLNLYKESGAKLENATLAYINQAEDDNEKYKRVLEKVPNFKPDTTLLSDEQKSSIIEALKRYPESTALLKNKYGISIDNSDINANDFAKIFQAVSNDYSTNQIISNAGGLLKFISRDENKNNILDNYFKTTNQNDVSEYYYDNVKKSIEDGKPQFYSPDYVNLIANLSTNIVKDENIKSIMAAKADDIAFLAQGDNIKNILDNYKIDSKILDSVPEILKNPESLKSLTELFVSLKGDNTNKKINSIFEFIKNTPTLRKTIQGDPRIIRDAVIGVVDKTPFLKDMLNSFGFDIKLLDIAVPLLKNIDQVQDLYNCKDAVLSLKDAVLSVRDIIQKYKLDENKEFISSLEKNKGEIVHLCNEMKLENKIINQVKEVLYKEEWTKRYLSNVKDLSLGRPWVTGLIGALNKARIYFFHSNQLTNEEEANILLDSYRTEFKDIEKSSFKDALEKEIIMNFNNLIFNKHANMSSVNFDKMDFKNTTFKQGANFNKSIISNSTFQPQVIGKLDLRGANITNTKFDFSSCKGRKFEIDLSNSTIDADSMKSLLASYEKHMNENTELKITGVKCPDGFDKAFKGLESKQSKLKEQTNSGFLSTLKKTFMVL